MPRLKITINNMEIIWIIAGFALGSIVTSKFFMKKKMEELEYHRKEELKIFDAKPLNNEDEKINTENFISIPLKRDLPDLNAIYENDSMIVKFHIDQDDASKFINVSTSFQERYLKNIQEKLANGDIVKIPKNIMNKDELEPMLESGDLEIYSKDDNTQAHEILCGHKNIKFETSTAMNEYYCLPNGKIILERNTGFMCGVRRPA